jgi:HAMP domain-containing protein
MGSDTTVLVAAGVAALGAAFAWRQAARHSRKARLIRRFASPMAERRPTAGAELVELGLGRACRPVLAHVQQEDDPQVRLAIALAVAKRQWEPGGSARVADLRSWARAELEHQGYEVHALGPAFTRLSDMGGPRLPSPDTEPGPIDAGATDSAMTGDPAATHEPLHWTPAPPAEGAAPLGCDGASGDGASGDEASGD